MRLQGNLFAETPIYRGNSRKTLFTRDGDGSQRLVSLAGEISGTAQSLMDAFTGRSRNGKNIGLLEQLWQRLYGASMPGKLISQVICKLKPGSYPSDNFFDMRMGLRLDEDRWAVEANANYKMETVLRNSVFDFSMVVNDGLLDRDDNRAKLYYLLQELQAGRFWFGAGKSKGLGRLRLDMKIPFKAPESTPDARRQANHLTLNLTFNALNPVLVGWNWGKVDDANPPAFTAIEGRLLLEAMQDLPESIRQRLVMSIGGPILSPDDWKQKLSDYLPRVLAIWLQEESQQEIERWVLPSAAVKKMSKGKFKLSKKVLAQLDLLIDQPYGSQAEAQAAVENALGAKSNMLNRVVKSFEVTREAGQEFDQAAWQTLAVDLGLDATLSDSLAAQVQDEAALSATLSSACQPLLRRLYEQVEQQINLLQSDAWLDEEIASRNGHLRIKQMLRRGEINERQWNNRNQAPEGVNMAVWREFLDSHRRVRFHHLLNTRNLQKSIANDENFIAFLNTYRARARQELSQPYHIDFRAGGPSSREISRKYGKPYDTMFMRMLTFSPSHENEGWEVYIPGSTLKGAFRKRASQVIRTLWGDSGRAARLIEHLFGRTGQAGIILFSDAYLVDPHEPEERWCVMDAVKMNPATGQPVEGAKRDYLFAYGDKLNFQFRIDLKDLSEGDLEALSLLAALLQDFQQGDIPVGGEKSSGFGWVAGELAGLTWLTGDTAALGQKLFSEATYQPEGIWQQLRLEGPSAMATMQKIAGLSAAQTDVSQPPQSRAGFISHRSFGGYSGQLAVEVEILSPTHIAESGEPSYRAQLDGSPINGWDHFAMAPAEAALRDQTKTYALPSKSLRGMLRHIYTIASNSTQPSEDISRLNPTDSLFGWVGRGPNQSIMSRIVVSFSLLESAEFGWFKIPYPYGGWRFRDGNWENNTGGTTPFLQVDGQWRLFPHVPLAPIVQSLDDFQPDAVQASYVRAILPGARARFTIRFWNLEEIELQRLIWSVNLGDTGAHKIGKHRHLGFGSLKLRLQPESHLIDWAKRYAGEAESVWQQTIQVDQWLNPAVIEHYQALGQAINADAL